MHNPRLQSRIHSLVHSSKVRSLEVCPDFVIGLDFNQILLVQPATTTPRLDDYELLRFLGEGANATVYLVREKQTSHLYALKAVEKYDPATGRKVSWDMVKNEQSTLRELNGNDFVLPLHACFHDSENFYLVTASAKVPCPCISRSWYK